MTYIRGFRSRICHIFWYMEDGGRPYKTLCGWTLKKVIESEKVEKHKRPCQMCIDIMEEAQTKIRN